jgi:hypothetical protein
LIRGYDSNPAYGKVTLMKCLFLIMLSLIVGSLVSGCGGRVERPPETPVTLIPERGGWFCQMHPSGTGWECVRDPELAANPRPDRLPGEARPQADARDDSGPPASPVTPSPVDPAVEAATRQVLPI